MPYLLLRFCLLGSFVGGGVFVATRDIAMSMHATPDVASTLMNLLGIPLWAVLTSFLSLPLGFVPATFAALLYWQVLARLTSRNPKAVGTCLYWGHRGLHCRSHLWWLFVHRWVWPGRLLCNRESVRVGCLGLYRWRSCSNFHWQWHLPPVVQVTAGGEWGLTTRST